MLLLALSAGGGDLLDQLGINLKVVGVQIAVFLATLAILHRLLFRRVTDFVRKREAEIGEALSRIQETRQEVERLSAEFRARLAEIDREADERLQAAIRQGLRAKAEIIARAEEEARREVEAARARIAGETEEARRALRAEAKRLAVEAAERILGQPIERTGHESALEEILSREKT